jgi:tRNA1(Val) A37 N6-methylase TrmN6
MRDYSQPDFYRFNSDSLHLVSWVKERFDSRPLSVLDIGAGCGVMGLELAQHFKPDSLTLLEFQKDFISHLKANIEWLNLPMKIRVEINSIGEWEVEEKFDLIVCNPPYYLPSAGKRSKDLRRDFSRSFLKDGWSVLASRLQKVQKNKSYLVIKDEPLIKKEALKHLEAFFEIREESRQSVILLELCLNKN